MKRKEQPTCIWVKETFIPPHEKARQAMRAYRRQYPKPAYRTEIDHWQELPSDCIEVIMRRLPTAD